MTHIAEPTGSTMKHASKPEISFHDSYNIGNRPGSHNEAHGTYRTANRAHKAEMHKVIMTHSTYAAKPAGSFLESHDTGNRSSRQP